jgi:hypothetical protein
LIFIDNKESRTSSPIRDLTHAIFKPFDVTHFIPSNADFSVHDIELLQMDSTGSLEAKPTAVHYANPLHTKFHLSAIYPPKWLKTDDLSKKKGPHANVYLMNGDQYIGDWDNNLKHGLNVWRNVWRPSHFLRFRKGKVYILQDRECV